MTGEILGRISSLESFGTLDGPGIRFVVFTKGCPLRCGCCHNPETQDESGGKLFSAKEILEKAMRCREYFGKDGGITVSGGEPLLQADFVRELFILSKAAGINTCLDTSGCILNEGVKKLLRVTDRVLLDIKYTEDTLYEEHVGCKIAPVLNFLDYLQRTNIKTTLRQVIIPTLNDSEENILKLKEIAKSHPCVDKIELLPFKKICAAKYEALAKPFPFADIPTPTKDLMQRLSKML